MHNLHNLRPEQYGLYECSYMDHTSGNGQAEHLGNVTCVCRRMHICILTWLLSVCVSPRLRKFISIPSDLIVMSGHAGYVTPTPTEWRGELILTPSTSCNVSRSLSNQSPSVSQNEHASVSFSVQALASPGRVGRDSVTVLSSDEEEAAMQRDMDLRMIENEGPPASLLTEEEERDSSRNAHLLLDDSISSELASESSSSAVIPCIDPEMITAHLNNDIAPMQVEVEIPLVPTAVEPRQFVMNLFDPKPELLPLSPRHHIHYSDAPTRDVVAAASAAVIPSSSIDLPAVLSSGDATSLRHALMKIAAEKTGLEHALRIEKNVSKLLETQARTAEANTLAAKEDLAREVTRAAEEACTASAVRMSQEQVALHDEVNAPIICGADGLPLVMADGFTEPTVEPATKTATLVPVAVMADAIMQTESIPVTPKKQMHDAYAATSPSLRSPVLIPTTRISRALLQSLAVEPLHRSSTSCRNASVDIRSLLSNYSQCFETDAARIIDSVRSFQHTTALNPPVVAAAAAAAVPVDLSDSAASEWMARYHSEKKQRQKLHNMVLEMQGNIRVFARIRPHDGMQPQIQPVSCSSSVETTIAAIAGTNPPDSDNQTRIIDDQTVGLNGKLFEFDRIFSPFSSQSDVYSSVAPFVQSVVDGFSTTIFAYGQTGAGSVIGQSERHLMDFIEMYI
jgi:hypothetical protein